MNVECKEMMSNGIWNVGIYTTRNLIPGEELLMDYDGDGELALMFDWI